MHDDPVSLTLAQSVRESLGHEVTTVTSGERAWQLLLAEPYDALVSDRQVPAVNGLELCRRLRARSFAGAADRPSDVVYCYVILVSAFDSDAEELEGLLAAADDYLSKPAPVLKVAHPLLDEQTPAQHLAVQLVRTCPAIAWATCCSCSPAPCGTGAGPPRARQNAGTASTCAESAGGPTRRSPRR